MCRSLEEGGSLALPEWLEQRGPGREEQAEQGAGRQGQVTQGLVGHGKEFGFCCRLKYS